MNRPKSALAALLLTIVAAVPATAQQVSLTPQPGEFCSGCFAYLEFPPLPEGGKPSSLAYTHQDTAAATTPAHGSAIVALTPDLVASVKQ